MSGSGSVKHPSGDLFLSALGFPAVKGGWLQDVFSEVLVATGFAQPTLG